jgi:sugar lactone lactonase YvrE
MKLRYFLLVALAIIALPWAARAWNRSPAVEFAALPHPLRNPEGLTVDRRTGEFYVADFDYRGTSATGRIAVFDQSGRLLRVLSLSSSPALLGLDFHPTTHELLVIDFGGKQVLRVDPRTGASSTFAVPALAPKSGLNALTFDKAGNVYVSDSFQGIIWKTGSQGGAATAWVTDTLLTTSGVPPFGANGISFNSAATAMLVANTGNDTIVTIPVTNGTPGTPTVLTNSINGADGIVLDQHDNIWVAANQADEIVVVDPTGKAIAKLGDFDGLTKDGTPIGLLFPASPAFGKDGLFLYVTNLALDLRLAVAPNVQAVDSQWAAMVNRYTVSKIRARIPPVATN